MDFLEHEMLETTLLRRSGIESQFGNLAGDGDVVQIPHVHRFGGDDGDVIVIQIDHPLGVGKNGRGIGSDDSFPIPHPDHDGTAAAGGDDFLRLARREHGDTEGAFHLMQGVANGLEQIALVAIADEVGQHLGIRLGIEMMPLAFETRAQRSVVLDDSIVDQGDITRFIKVRVGIHLGGRTVSGPAGVGDTGIAAAETLGRPLCAGALAERGNLAR